MNPRKKRKLNNGKIIQSDKQMNPRKKRKLNNGKIIQLDKQIKKDNKKERKTYNSIKQKNKCIQTDGFQVNSSAVITAFIVYEFMGQTMKTKTNNKDINATFADVEKYVLENIIDNKFQIPDKFIELKYKSARHISSSKRKECARNIYLNLCESEEFYKKLKNTFTCLHKKEELINLENILVLKTFESKRSHCIKCQTKLQRIERYKGTICVSYGKNEGPQVGRSFCKKCPECNTKYSYGAYEDENSKVRESLKDLDYYELSPKTYFEKSLFKHLIHHLFVVCKGFELYAEAYNILHEETIIKTKKQVELQEKLLGSRQQSEPTLEVNRLIEAFYLFTLQTELEQYCDQSLIIEKDIEDQLVKEKKNRLNLHRNCSKEKSSQELSQDSSEGSSQGSKRISERKRTNLTNTDLFEYWYQKHEDIINATDHGILNWVPVNKKTGKPYIGHFIGMMDGNSKNIRYVCSYYEDDELEGKYNICVT